MNSRFLPAAIACALSLAGFSAHAVQVNISATSAATTDVTLAAGTYNIQWIGTAQGGQYDGWQYNAASSGNWREAFTVTSGNVTATVDHFLQSGTYYANFSTAADALAAFSSGYYVVNTGSGWSTPAATASFTLPGTTTLHFGVPDYLFSDNTGGVSLSITAVPEPSTNALLLAGLLAVGGLVRKRLARSH